jgi:hypothetical protein
LPAETVELEGELVRVPEVVVVEEGDGVARCCLQSDVAGRARAAAGAWEEAEGDGGVGCERGHDLARANAIINYQ